MTANVKILKPGLLTTIQDRGRLGYAQYGVPQSGAMDQLSYKFANSLLGNQSNAACIEWTFQPPVLQFSEPTEVVLTGANASAFLNGSKVHSYRRIQVQRNNVLKMDFCKTGVYGYIAIKGGFLSPTALSSKSFYKSVTPQHILIKNDMIPYTAVTTFENHFSNIVVNQSIESDQELEVFRGAEFDLLSDQQKTFITNHQFTISNTINRMAIRLEEKLHNQIPSMLTGPVLPGTVQLTPSGVLVILMRDCQTTGGYPRILQLSESAMDQIAQKRMKQRCSFRLI